MSATNDQQWACGCYAVNGGLVRLCTQTRPQGEVSAEQHGATAPFSPKCYRQAEQNTEASSPATTSSATPAATEAHTSEEPAADLEAAQNEQTEG